MSSKSKAPNFLGLKPPLSRRDGARFHVLPVPYEATVSYGGGTARGPAAILEASTQVEFFDGISTPCEEGIFTDTPIPLRNAAPATVMRRIKQRVKGILKDGRLPVVLGGEHSVTLGPAQALVESGVSFGLVQFDAHADLRDTYSGSPYSHASVTRRIVELGIPAFQFGVRSICEEEVEARRKYRVGHLDARQIARRGIPARVLPSDFPKNIYVTFDVDGLDASIMAATGTPEPGGLTWREAVEILEKVIGGRRVVGFDVVELAPVPLLHAANYTAAKLVYTIMGLIVRNGK